MTAGLTGMDPNVKFAFMATITRCFCSVTSRKINLDFCSSFEIRLLVESSYNKTNDLF